MSKECLRDNEFKKWSQNGEDGIIKFLHSKLEKRNYRFIEIGCADGMECNSRFLLESGWSGIGVDADPKKIARFRSMEFDQAILIPEKVTLETIEGLSSRFPQDPDFFSLDIDSYDYFIGDYLFRAGFRPKIVCLEVNTFLQGPVTVEYIDPFSRYAIHRGYGLYFGCSPEAWRHLWQGYTYCGMDSTYTNAFFFRGDLDIDPGERGYQTFFCRKYGKTGEELSGTMDYLPFLDVTSQDYQQAYENRRRNDVH